MPPASGEYHRNASAGLLFVLWCLTLTLPGPSAGVGGSLTVTVS